MPMINVKLIEGVFDAAQKQEMIEKLTDTMVGIEGENMRSVMVGPPPLNWCFATIARLLPGTRVCRECREGRVAHRAWHDENDCHTHVPLDEVAQGGRHARRVRNNSRTLCGNGWLPWRLAVGCGWCAALGAARGGGLDGSTHTQAASD